MDIITSIILLPLFLILCTNLFVSALPTPTWDDVPTPLTDFSFSLPPMPAPPPDDNQNPCSLFPNGVERPNPADFLPSTFTDTGTAFGTSILTSAIASTTTSNPNEAIDFMFSAQETISNLEFPIELPSGFPLPIFHELNDETVIQDRFDHGIEQGLTGHNEPEGDPREKEGGGTVWWWLGKVVEAVGVIVDN
ncbi:hypothetical protein FPQ18DRAFT_310823 [Pyronema domesticum]|nr:hypothetical protein FPQ18DRAFT_310823 [Pyronema domesticum]